tara:strand:- start:39 stop:146 length:108 start_codon:yes stop_codon:yes gene_type:complete
MSTGLSLIKKIKKYKTNIRTKKTTPIKKINRMDKE